MRRDSGNVTYEKRPLRPDDAAAWLVLLNTLTVADGNDLSWSHDEVARRLGDPSHDLGRDSLGYFEGQEMVAYGMLGRREQADPVHEMRYDGGVHPAHRGRGLGGDLLDWAQRQAVPIHEDAFPGRGLTLGSGCVSTNAAATALHESRGFALVRYFNSMARDLRPPVARVELAAGLRVEAFTAERSEDGRLIRNESFHDHWSSEEVSREAWEHRRTASAFRSEFSYLVYEEDDPLGIVVCHEYESASGLPQLYIALVGTRAAGRKRGIASALLSRVLAQAQSAGFGSASLHVDADSLTGAVGLYERLGFRVKLRTSLYRKELLPA